MCYLRHFLSPSCAFSGDPRCSRPENGDVRTTLTVIFKQKHLITIHNIDNRHSISLLFRNNFWKVELQYLSLRIPQGNNYLRVRRSGQISISSCVTVFGEMLLMYSHFQLRTTTGHCSDLSCNENLIDRKCQQEELCSFIF
ncbi:hypothetical protein NE237_020995 [Protea cynaroides]|uniref:Uncharacterized protein n=1 Tax=Protea cynaroides TaxID=273540 RepID=A0A9Q0K3Y7_9MAGN|nr:hypothetical protein NE237_020995 [Protea cynaroides]